MRETTRLHPSLATVSNRLEHREQTRDGVMTIYSVVHAQLPRENRKWKLNLQNPDAHGR